MINCRFCKQSCIRYGKQSNGEQRYRCKQCRRMQQASYTKYAYGNLHLQSWIINLVKEGCGIRSIARLLKIAVATVLRTIRKIAAGIPKPPVPLKMKSVEVDELRTYIKHKRNEWWVAYALNPVNGEVVDFITGRRSKRTLRMLINTLLIAEVKQIKTDNLNIYQSLIPGKNHEHNSYCINHIERKNLDLRTHLKRLSRRTTCFSRSLGMLNACLKIYFWGNGLSLI